MKFVLSFVLVFGFGHVFGVTYLPSYIRPCKQSDPDFDKCALESAKYAVPYIVKGDKQFKIPNLIPLEIPLVELHTGDKFNLKLTDLKVFGIDNLVPLSIHSDFDKKHVHMVLGGTKQTLKADYEMDGSILVFPLKGKGKSTTEIIGGVFEYSFDWKLETKDGVEYGIPMNSKLDFKVKKAQFNFENLFNGDEQLGKETNRLLNENWEAIYQDIKPVVAETILKVCDNIAKQFISDVPYNEVFKQ